jgi:hypothetical protein
MSLSELPFARTAALVLYYADSFWSSATAYGLTKLLLYWHDNRQRLPIRRLLCLLEYSMFLFERLWHACKRVQRVQVYQESRGR